MHYIGEYIDSVNFPVRVDSKLFKLGAYASSPAFADFQAEKLHMVVPCQLLAKSDVNVRNFSVRQAPAWSGTNQSLNYCDSIVNVGTLKLIHTEWFGGAETNGNYGTDPEGNPTYAQQTWGAEKRMDFYPVDIDANGDYIYDGNRGFFCPKVSFNAAISLRSGNSSFLVEQPRLEIPIAGEDAMVLSIQTASSDMRFKMFIGVYEDEFMVKKIPVQDVNGDDIILTMADVINTQAGFSNKTSNSDPYDYYQCEDGHEEHGTIIGTNANVQDMILFEDFTGYLPSGEEIFINGGSRYGINYFIEPFDGELEITYPNAFDHRS